MDQDALIAKVKILMGDLSTAISDEGYAEAVESAEVDLGWSLPLSDSDKFKIHWMSRRTQRHAIHILYIQSADKFKHKQENLQHRFEHYSKLISRMDREFINAMDDDPTKFAGVDVEKMFGLYAGVGFQTNSWGVDVTYE